MMTLFERAELLEEEAEELKELWVETADDLTDVYTELFDIQEAIKGFIPDEDLVRLKIQCSLLSDAINKLN